MIDTDISKIYSLKNFSTSSHIQLKHMIRYISTLPNDTAIRNSIELLGRLYAEDFPPQRIFPAGGLGGGVGFMYYNSLEQPAMFEVENEGKIWAGYLTEDTSFVQRINLENKEETQEVIKKLKNFISN